MTRALAAVVLAGLLAAACASHPPGASPVSSPATQSVVHPQHDETDRLRKDLQTIFTASEVDHALWGVKIQSLSTGDTLYSHNSSKLFLPGSNQKLFTSAVAAERLGWDYRFTTRILTTGPIGEDGTLNGDLIVVSNGDPTINRRHATRWNVFEQWAAALRELGIRVISGQLIGDDDAFEEPGLGQGWSWDNLPYGYGTAVGALQYNESQAEVIIGPALQPTARAIVALSPIGHGLTVDNEVKTVAADARTNVDISRLPGSPLLHVTGEIAAGSKPVTITAAVENPTRLYINAFQEALARHGITVRVGAIDVDDLYVPPDLTHATELLVDHSPPLSEIIDVCLKWSRNEYAETLLRALAPADQPATTAAGLDALREQLATWDIGPDLYLARDGSGLSRQDYVSPEAITRLLIRLSKEPKHDASFRSTLPVAGTSGTLADRMKGTPAENRVWAKTGTLSSIRTLSGYAVTEQGEPIVFSMMANNFLTTEDAIDATMEKALIRVISER